MFKCKHCNNDSFYMQKKSIHVGMYCNKCKAWKQWLSNAEVRKYRIMGVVLKEEESINQIKIGDIEND